MKIAGFLIVVLLLFGAPARAETQVAADFEKGTDGFAGAVTQDTTTAKEGSASGKIAADFTGVTERAWTIVKKSLDLKDPIQSVSFWVKTSDAKQLTVRLDDSTGQVLQVRPAIQPNGEWQQVTIDSFEAGPGFQAYGGAGDRTVHWPAKAMAIILEKNGLADGKTAGSVWIDQVELKVEGKAAETKGVSLGDFEDGQDGFAGAIEQDSTQAKTGRSSGKIAVDFSGGGNPWVAVARPLEFSDALQELRFWVKSSEAKNLAVRLTDSTGQAHMVRPALQPGDEWQEVIITDFTTGRGHQTYGGAGDGQVHWPAQKLEFIVEKGSLGGEQGVVWLDGVEVSHGPEN